MTAARDQSFYEILQVSHSASPEEIEASYVRLLDVLGPHSLAMYSIVDEGELDRMRDLVDEAYRTLSDPDRRRAYDGSQPYSNVMVPDTEANASVSYDHDSNASMSHDASSTLTHEMDLELQRLLPELQAAVPSHDTGMMDSFFEAAEEPPARPSEASFARLDAHTVPDARSHHWYGAPGDYFTNQDWDNARERAGSSTKPLHYERQETRRISVVENTGRRTFGKAPLEKSGDVQERESSHSQDTEDTRRISVTASRFAGMNRKRTVSQVSATASSVSRRRLPSQAQFDVKADTEYNGQVLQQLRESCEISLEEICEITKISRRYLNALESDDYEALPAPVYMRGFVSEYARVLGLDPLVVSKSYMDLYRRHRNGAG